MLELIRAESIEQVKVARELFELALQLLRFIHNSRGETAKPFLQRAVEEEIRKYGHRDDR